MSVSVSCYDMLGFRRYLVPHSQYSRNRNTALLQWCHLQKESDKPAKGEHTSHRSLAKMRAEAYGGGQMPSVSSESLNCETLR